MRLALALALALLAIIIAVLTCISIRRASQHVHDALNSPTEADDIWLAQCCGKAMQADGEGRLSHSKEHEA